MVAVNAFSKAVKYRRFRWCDEDTLSENLETVLRKVLNTYKNVHSSKYFRADGSICEIRHRQVEPSLPVSLHIVRYTPNATTSTVPQAGTTVEADLDTLSPPPGQDFMDGDFFLLVSDNHIISCESKLSEAAVRDYLEYLFKKFDDKKYNVLTQWMKIANVKKRTLIAKSGVKAVHLDVFNYSETLARNKKTEHSLSDSVLGTILGILTKERSMSELREAQNLHARLTLTFDKRRKVGALKEEDFTRFATQLSEDENAQGYVIETRSGEKISSTELLLQKKVDIVRYGNTVPYKTAWGEMKIYLQELRDMEALVE